MKAQNVPRDKNGNVLRPNILMFGDWDWNSQRTDEQKERLNEWLATVIHRNPTSKLSIVEIGAGCDVPTVRNFSEMVAMKKGEKWCRIIRINTLNASISLHGNHFSFSSGAKETLDGIGQLYWRKEGMGRGD
eukprot:TRINITY_DN3271_c0_g1_i4.p1 TRINITY_DN3271_c0_g1~~TRINITY_DN3271_c0_g1_i4.p1  ORF type:complete len:132 (-),score=34.23 TRINITY_DN3271_c0_g1_i4:50-445(-)